MTKKKDQKEEKQEQPEEQAQEAAEEEPVEAQPVAEPSQEALDEARAEAEKNRDLFLRTRADLENFRKRSQREKEELQKFANENLLREILPVIDNLERAVEHARMEEGESAGLLQGVEMTLDQMRKAVAKFGVTPVDALGEVFDPALHEAMGQMESKDQAPNTVVQEMQKGYLLQERLLRPALVMVAAPPSEDKPSEEE